MAATYSPAYPLPGDTVTVSQTVTVNGTTVAVADPEVTFASVPDASEEHEAGLLVDSSGVATVSFVPDVSGDYVTRVLAFQEFAAPAAFGADEAEPRKVAIDEDDLTIYVGMPMQMAFAFGGGHALTLEVGVFNGTVRTAELRDWTSEKMYAATLDTGIATKLAALVGVTAATVGPDLPAVVNTLITKYAGHLSDLSHANEDEINVYSLDRPYDNADAIRQLNLLSQTISRHLLGASSYASAWHAADDTKNVISAPPATSLTSAIVLYADMYRVFEAHRVQVAAPASHSGSGDTTNGLGTADKLTDLVQALLAFIATESPSAPAGTEDGALTLQSMYGFTPVTD